MFKLMALISNFSACLSSKAHSHLVGSPPWNDAILIVATITERAGPCLTGLSDANLLLTVLVQPGANLDESTWLEIKCNSGWEL